MNRDSGSYPSHPQSCGRHLTLHGLRAGGAVRLCLLRWTPQEIAGWGGWKNIKQVMKYIEDLDRQALADERVREHNAAAGRQPRRLKVVRCPREGPVAPAQSHRVAPSVLPTC